jgi:peptidoglycan-N-acetylglucosamine deacetylase
MQSNQGHPRRSGGQPLRNAARISLVLATLLTAACATTAAQERDREIWGFTGPWDERSVKSALQYGNRLDAVVTGWIALDSATGMILEGFPDEMGYQLQGNTRLMAIVTSWHADRFHPRSVRMLAADPVRLGRVAGEIARRSRAAGYWGLILDFELMEQRDLPALLAVSRAIADSARSRGVTRISMAIPAGDTAAYPAARLVEVVDDLIIMLYDQHWSTSEPGPVAAPEWFRRMLALRISEVGRAKIIAGLPLYGYRWPVGGAPASTVTWQEARVAAGESGLTLTRDPVSGTLNAARTGQWEIWVTDAELVQRLMRESEQLGVRRFAFWHLGQEDPSLWSEVIR